jgi:predicted branched-subunit amino acid permease
MWFRLVGAPMVIDPTWSLATRLADDLDDSASLRRQFLAGGLTLGVGFSTSVVAGMVLGTHVEMAALMTAVPLCLLAMLVPGLGRSSSRRAIVAAGIAGGVTSHWPAGSGLIMAIAVGSVAANIGRRPTPATVGDRRMNGRRPTQSTVGDRRHQRSETDASNGRRPTHERSETDAMNGRSRGR